MMAGLGVEKLEKLMPEIVSTASKVDIAPHVRDGYIMMFIYLPITFGDKFTPYVGPIIPCILKVRSLSYIIMVTLLNSHNLLVHIYTIWASLSLKLKIVIAGSG